ncbi:MAG TPA: hypothetical protein VF544_03740 [Pyrinomonadaceae bacterium]|jgi:hypothetical protein
MYCSSCGVAVAQGLSYCNYCGAKLNVAKADSVVKSSEIKPESLIQAMAAVFICGLGAIAVLIGVMKAVIGLSAGLIVAFMLLCFLIMLGVEAVFMRLLLQRNRGVEEKGASALSKGQATKELDQAQPRVLPEPVPSVTEHTTRAFGPTYGERASK